MTQEQTIQSPQKNPLPATGSFHESQEENSWTEKLRRTFGMKAGSERREGIADKTSMNFGTGEGHLAVYPESNEYSYSGSAFEGAFSGMGVSQQHAHSLVSDLRRGGAIASVNANDRLNDAERVLTLNNGRIRYEASTNALPSENIPDGRVHIYGELSKPYTSYLSQADPARRKAS